MREGKGREKQKQKVLENSYNLFLFSLTIKLGCSVIQKCVN
jgi:hypothetical protein